MEKRSNSRVISLDVYTDGSCKSTGALHFGGWSFIVVRDSKKIYEAAGSENNTTNQRMELQAVLEALNYIKSIRRSSESVIIFSDSAYLVNCYQQEWYIDWMTHGWLNSQNKPVANKDLWEKIVPFFDDFWYTFRKVQGHNGNIWNEACDKLAQSAADNARINWRGHND